MIKSKLFITTFLLFVFFVNQSFAQKPPIKFGKVSMDELEMTTYAIDSGAPAVILCDYGRWDLRDYMFRKTIRIKILSKEGLDYANQVYPSDKGTTIKGKTYNLVDGEIQVNKLKHESIFKERIYEGYYNWRIAMPNVKVGSVIDIEISHFGIPSIWYFQKDIPVKWSELIIPESRYIDYRKHSFGTIPLYVYRKDHWIAKDMPAFKSEPFINSAENYIRKFEFDILSYHIPGYLYKDFTTDWNAVARRLSESSYFGGVLNKAFYLSEEVKEIAGKDSTQLGQMKLAFQAAKKIKWNEEIVIMTTKPNLSSVYKEKIGNSADINLLLVNLLRKLKINAYPVVLSTRSNGLLPLYSPSINKLNYVIAYAKIDNVEYLLDATDEFTPLGILPERCINEKGHVMSDTHSQPVSLSVEKKDDVTKMYNLTVSDNFVLKGTANTRYKDYGAYNFRHYYNSFNSQDDFIHDLMKQNKGISVKNYQLEGFENINKPIQETYDIEIKNKMYQLDDKLYLIPLLHLTIDENPFKFKERKLPVSFPYGSKKNYIINFSLPANYTVSELPKSLRMVLPDKAGSVIYSLSAFGRKIVISYKFDINKSNFTKEEYQYLRQLYIQIIKKQSEPIIMIKNE